MPACIRCGAWQARLKASQGGVMIGRLAGFEKKSQALSIVIGSIWRRSSVNTFIVEAFFWLWVWAAKE